MRKWAFYSVLSAAHFGTQRVLLTINLVQHGRGRNPRAQSIRRVNTGTH